MKKTLVSWPEDNTKHNDYYVTCIISDKSKIKSTKTEIIMSKFVYTYCNVTTYIIFAWYMVLWHHWKVYKKIVLSGSMKTHTISNCSTQVFWEKFLAFQTFIWTEVAKQTHSRLLQCLYHHISLQENFSSCLLMP